MEGRVYIGNDLRQRLQASDTSHAYQYQICLTIKPTAESMDAAWPNHSCGFGKYFACRRKPWNKDMLLAIWGKTLGRRVYNDSAYHRVRYLVPCIQEVAMVLYSPHTFGKSVHTFHFKLFQLLATILQHCSHALKIPILANDFSFFLSLNRHET